MPALLLDVGNTRLKWGVSSGPDITDTQSLSLSKLNDAGLSALIPQLPPAFDRIFISSVAGATVGTRLRGALTAHFNVPVHFARTEADAFGVRVAYAEPRRLGVDRWVAMVGAYDRLGAACLIVDAGTAVTVDAVNRDGRHLGGQILPGARLMLETLHRHTGDLPDLSDDPGTGTLGLADRTDDAMRSGVWSAIVGAVRQAVNDPAFDEAPVIVLTGGDAPSILKSLPGVVEHRPHLVLEGLASMLGSLD